MRAPTSLADRIVESVCDLVACATGEPVPVEFVRSLQRLVEAEVLADVRRSAEIVEALDAWRGDPVLVENGGDLVGDPPAPATVVRLSEAAKEVLAEAIAHDHELDRAEAAEKWPTERVSLDVEAWFDFTAEECDFEQPMTAAEAAAHLRDTYTKSTFFRDWSLLDGLQVSISIGGQTAEVWT